MVESDLWNQPQTFTQFSIALLQKIVVEYTEQTDAIRSQRGTNFTVRNDASVNSMVRKLYEAMHTHSTGEYNVNQGHACYACRGQEQVDR